MEDDLKWRKSGITKAGNVEAEIFPIKKHKCPNENGKFKAKKLKLVSNQSLKCIRKYQSSFETSSAKESIRCEALFRCEKRINTNAQRTAQLEDLKSGHCTGRPYSTEIASQIGHEQCVTATVMLVTLWCWWLTVDDNWRMLATDLRLLWHLLDVGARR